MKIKKYNTPNIKIEYFFIITYSRREFPTYIAIIKKHIKYRVHCQPPAFEHAYFKRYKDKKTITE